LLGRGQAIAGHGGDPLLVLPEELARCSRAILQLSGQVLTLFAKRPKSCKLVTQCGHEQEGRLLFLPDLAQEASPQQVLLRRAGSSRGRLLGLTIERRQKGFRLSEVSSDFLPGSRCEI